MKLSQFKFKLPEEQIALYPPHRSFKNEDGTVERVYSRDQSRLMVIHRKRQAIEMYKKDSDGNDTDQFLTFRNLVDYFDEGDTFVFNDTKVFPARLFGTKEKTDAQIEVFLLRELNQELRLWDVLVEPARKIRIGNKLFFEEEGPMVAEVIDNTTSRGRTLRFLYDCDHDEFKRELFSLGSAPLPRYIVDRRATEPEDMENFQTIFARNEGAVTAPATGLHFSRELLKMMEIRGFNVAYLTVHCGLIISNDCCERVNSAKQAGHRICTVGVSTTRAAETAVGTDGMLKPFDGWTNKFIFPPYDFGLANAMIANFYHPESTMMMLTAAFGGYEIVYEAYEQAVKNGYQFGCYGDAVLILDD